MASSETPAASTLSHVRGARCQSWRVWPKKRDASCLAVSCMKKPLNRPRWLSGRM